MPFKCEKCNYESNDKSNYNRHIKSLAHINKSKNAFECVCGKKFAHQSGLSRHKKLCVGSSEYENDDKIDKLEGQMSELISKVEEVKNINGILIDLIKNNKITNNTYNISVKNYIQQYYPDAPTLKGSIDYAKLTYDGDELVDTLIYKYKHKCLYKYLGDFLVQCYKKADPAEQSVWSSDISRLTYLVKESMENKKSIWNHDYKGIKTQKCIIDPLLQYVKKSIETYWAKNINKEIPMNNNEVDVAALNERQQKFNITYAIETGIDNGNLANEIIKYIASYLHLDKSIMEKTLNMQLCVIDE